MAQAVLLHHIYQLLLYLLLAYYIFEHGPQIGNLIGLIKGLKADDGKESGVYSQESIVKAYEFMVRLNIHYSPTRY